MTADSIFRIYWFCNQLLFRVPILSIFDVIYSFSALFVRILIKHLMYTGSSTEIATIKWYALFSSTE